MKLKVFVRAAPAPTRILQPLLPEAPPTLTTAPNGKPCQVTVYVRTFEVRRPGILQVTLRQQLHLRQMVGSDGTPTSEKPKICKIVMQMLKK